MGLQIHSEFDQKYINSSKNKLKKTLKHLKSLKSSYRKKESESFNHQSAYKSNFWKYCERVFDPNENRVKPNFNELDCYNYFQKNLSEKNRSAEYSTPSWMRKLDIPSIGFHLQAPTYKEITKIIFKMKSSASPCPLDRVSIIVLKNAPILELIFGE